MYDPSCYITYLYKSENVNLPVVCTFISLYVKLTIPYQGKLYTCEIVQYNSCFKNAMVHFILPLFLYTNIILYLGVRVISWVSISALLFQNTMSFIVHAYKWQQKCILSRYKYTIIIHIYVFSQQACSKWQNVQIGNFLHFSYMIKSKFPPCNDAIPYVNIKREIQI